MPHFVYILQSLKDSKYYIGETVDLEERLLFHNNGRQPSTKHRIPFNLVLFEKFDNRTEALKIKKWKGGMAFKLFIQGGIPA